MNLKIVTRKYITTKKKIFAEGAKISSMDFTTLGLTDPSPWAGNGRAQ